MKIIISLLLTTAAWAQISTPPDLPKTEIPFESEQTLLKFSSSVGPLKMTCKQRYLGPEREIVIRYNFYKNKQLKIAGTLLQTKTYNACENYKFKVSNDMKITMVANPGERVNEPGAFLTTTFNWNKTTKKFEEIHKELFSPYRKIQEIYQKALAANDLVQAERVVVTNRQKIEPILENNVEAPQNICEEFHKAYKKKAEIFYSQKKYQDSFDLLMNMRQKFGDPQNIFFDAKSKKKSLVVICPGENANNDQSEDLFYTFAKRYLNKTEYVPFLIKKAQQIAKHKTTTDNELAIQILKFTSYTLKTAANGFQRLHQADLNSTWNILVNDNAEHPEYERLANEDMHLIFLMAEVKKCKNIAPPILKRLNQKDDSLEILKSMTLTAGDDFYTEGLFKSAIEEYKQFVQGRVLLKKCDEIPKIIFERYFKFIHEQPYEN